MNIEALKQQLCQTLCRSVSVIDYKGGAIVSLPMYDRDGDGYSIYLNETAGGWMLSDGASTVMRLSYENDTESLLKGSKRKLFDTYIADAGATYDDGELLLETGADQLVGSLFTFTQMMSRVSDLALLKTHRVASTFYDDLRSLLTSIIPPELIHEDYVVPNVPDAENYKVNYFIDAQRPLYIFGAKGQTSLQLVTITLQHLQLNAKAFDSIVILSDIKSLPSKDVERLMVAANDIVPRIEDIQTIERKIRNRIPFTA